jgi:hypothetical protein
MPPHIQEQQLPSFPTSTPTPIIQEPDQHEHSSGSQHTLVDDESIEQGDHPLSQLDLSEDDGERPSVLHVHPAQVKQQDSRKCKKKSILKEWRLEIAMSALSILLSTAIVFLLKQYDKHPMPSWSFHLNVNSLVAILSTFLRSCLFMILAQGLFNIADILTTRLMNERIVISQLKWSWHTHPRPLQHLQYYDQASRGPLGSFIFFFRIRHL